jgi:hypothetical protein
VEQNDFAEIRTHFSFFAQGRRAGRAVLGPKSCTRSRRGGSTTSARKESPIALLPARRHGLRGRILFGDEAL